MTQHPRPRQILVLPHAIDRYIERVMGKTPPQPRVAEMDDAVTAVIRAALMQPGAWVSRPKWRPKGVQRIVETPDLRIVVRGGVVVTVMGK